jgi:hypothetical protein
MLNHGKLKNQNHTYSKKSFAHTFIFFIFGPGLFGGLIGTALPLKDIIVEGSIEPFFIGLSIFSWAFAFYVIYFYFNNSPSIKINSSSINLNKLGKLETVEFSDVETVELKQKSSISFLGRSYLAESTILKLKSGQQLIIWDDFYRNIDDLKRRLNDIKSTLNPNRVTQKPPIQESVIPSNEIFKCIKGRLLTNFEFLTFLAIGIMMFFVIFMVPNAPTLFLLGVVVVIFFLIANQLHYFKISDVHFEVKNHIYWWSTTTVSIKDIQEISSFGIGIKVMKNDFSSNTFKAVTLRAKHFEELKIIFVKLGIKYRSEQE